MTPGFLYEPDPDHLGWMRWGFRDPDRFNSVLGRVIVRVEPDRRVRMRAVPERRHSNLADKVHGGALLGFIDIALFATCRGLGIVQGGGALTLDLSAQFIAAADLGRDLDFVSEVLRETGRLVFIRGLVEQDEAVIASYAGTIRKPSS